MEPVMQRTADGWQMLPRQLMTIGMKHVDEPDTATQPVKLTNLPKGTNVGGLAISPDGSRLLYTVYTGSDAGSLRSQMFIIRTDGSGGEEIISDGRTLDITPSFSPGGDQIVFASNRAGRRMNIWSMSAIGAPGVTRLTAGDTNDLWPSLDADPKPRLFYQVMVDNQSQPRIWSSQVGTFFQAGRSLASAPRATRCCSAWSMTPRATATSTE
jgi:dipeptidyl aminopeptidase/acylaminoacyl peptidase